MTCAFHSGATVTLAAVERRRSGTRASMARYVLDGTGRRVGHVRRHYAYWYYQEKGAAFRMLAHRTRPDRRTYVQQSIVDDDMMPRGKRVQVTGGAK